MPARLFGTRAGTGGHWEGLYLGSSSPGAWRVIGQTRGKLQPGEKITIYPAHDPLASERLQLTLLERESEGIWSCEVDSTANPFELLERFGTVPLPPYMHRDLANAEDRERYQTLYARHPGAVAAPTAGLHFSPELLAACRQREIEFSYVTLHVGLGTFRPITAASLDEHRMHSEWCELTDAAARTLRSTRERGARIAAVGTTTVRTLETAARSAGSLQAWSGETEIFIRPPYQFQAVDILLTNFHLPRSTLLILLSAFAGRERVLAAYAEAVRQKYRFYSYGDAMLIL